ncbi:MAG TPA: Ig-like domain-containing protein [Candidatus Limnocylindrales bacterium]|nr:Ig-like domain-containing protein [Candidatus Limnocylindrales bacterium]
MRKLAAAALAVPVLAIVYLPLLARRSVAARVGLVASVGVIVLVAALGLSRPVVTTASQPAPPITALADSAFRSIDAATDLHAAVDITFSEAMDPRSVAASLTVTPATATSISWNAARTVLTVRPTSSWAPGTYHTITVAAGTLAAGGRPMSTAVRAAFITRAPTSGRIAPTLRAGNATSLATAFRITFDHPVAIDEVATALKISPTVDGKLVADSGRPDVIATSALGFTFTPAAVLAGGTAYRLTLGPLVDTDGAAVGSVETVAVRTSAAPRIVRFRPADGTKKVERRAALSVRFSDPMDHVSTRAAFTVTANGKPVHGTYRFAESSTVLVFQPVSALPAGAKVVISIGATATSAQGVQLARASSATLTTVPKRKAAPRTAPTVSRSSSGSGSSGSSSSGGGAVGGGSWGAVETYYLRLMNCTRTGGWVTSTGSCSSPGGRNVAPLKLDAGISSHVSRPYAKKLAVGGWCDHFIGGNPGDRLRSAGYTSYIWAENLGCRSGNPYSAVLGSHLFFQSEKPYSGGHYVNLMNSAYDRVGIGVWVSGGRVRLVIDFYHPR